MRNERFEELVNGPLDHPLVPFKITRLILALRLVVELCGEAGDRALEEACRARQEQDDRNDWGG